VAQTAVWLNMGMFQVAKALMDDRGQYQRQGDSKKLAAKQINKLRNLKLIKLTPLLRDSQIPFVTEP
jgi:hypothetical protein